MSTCYRPGPTVSRAAPHPGKPPPPQGQREAGGGRRCPSSDGQCSWGWEHHPGQGQGGRRNRDLLLPDSATAKPARGLSRCPAARWHRQGWDPVTQAEDTQPRSLLRTHLALESPPPGRQVHQLCWDSARWPAAEPRHHFIDEVLPGVGEGGVELWGALASYPESQTRGLLQTAGPLQGSQPPLHLCDHCNHLTLGDTCLTRGHLSH